MYLSYLELNREQCKDLRLFNRLEMHKFVYQLFQKKKRDFLFDIRTEGNNIVFLIQSYSIPKNTLIDDLIEVKEIRDSFFEYKKYLMEVSFCYEIRDSKTGQRHPVTDERAGKYLARRLNEKGVICDNLIKQSNFVYDGRYDRRNMRRRNVIYRGEITPKYNVKFKELISNGIGKCKCDGFGLIHLKPIKK